MTDKEMHRLSRRELLQLLLAQVSETEDLKRLLAERDGQLTGLQENYEKLRKRLDQKDAKIHELRDTLREERTTRRIELEEAGSIAEAALRLNGIFDMAQKAADQYLENVKRLYEGPLSGEDAGLDGIEDAADGERPLEQADEAEEGLLTENGDHEVKADDWREQPEGREGDWREQPESGDDHWREQQEGRNDDWREQPEGGDDHWAEQPEGRNDDWREQPEGGDDDWAGLPEGRDDDWAELPEDREDAPMEFAKQDGQKALWQENEKGKRKKRWKRPAWNR